MWSIFVDVFYCDFVFELESLWKCSMVINAIKNLAF